MKNRIIIWFLALISFSQFVDANPVAEKIINNSVDSYESQEIRSTSFKQHENKLDLVDKQPVQKMADMLMKTNSAADNERDPFAEGNRRILEFGRRVIESVKKYGITDKEARLLKSGEYKFNWWKKNHRLEKIRKRLSEELEKKPDLKQHLRSLGWRNASAPISSYKKSRSDHSNIKMPIRSNKELKNTLLYKTLAMSFESLRVSASEMSKETGIKEPVIFVYMPITIASSESEIEWIKEAPTTEVTEVDSPMKISLNTFNEEDLDQTVSDFGVVDVMSSETSTFHGDDNFSQSHSSGQEFDSDRLLLLIPLVVEELRSGLLSEAERRAFSWIFGKRLWPLLEREASKHPSETMDEDLAMFVFKGKLVERESEKKRLRRRQRRYVLQRPIVDEVAKKKHDYDYDLEDEYDDQPMNDWSSGNFGRKKTNQGSVLELFELAAKHKLRKVEEEKKEREKEEKQEKWMDDDYDEYDYENDY